MKAITYRENGGPDVLHLVDRPEPEPGPGEVLVRVAVSGVNPTDWKARQGGGRPMQFAEVVPNQDGAGTVVAVGPGVDPGRVGQRVWLWEAAWQRADGTAQELVALPDRQAVPLPDSAPFELGASLGIPALTAHRCLTVADGVPSALHPGALADRVVLVAGGAGAVGHAAIELAGWAGARVVATVSSAEKAALARAAGAHHVVDYRAGGAAEAVREFATSGVDIVVEVAPVTNAELDRAVLARGGAVVSYAADGDDALTVPLYPAMVDNHQYHFVLVYTVPAAVKRQAVDDVAAAVAAGALRVGAEAGLPLHRYPLDQTAAAHVAVQRGAVGKVVIDV